MARGPRNWCVGGAERVHTDHPASRYFIEVTGNRGDPTGDRVIVSTYFRRCPNSHHAFAMRMASQIAEFEASSEALWLKTLIAQSLTRITQIKGDNGFITGKQQRVPEQTEPFRTFQHDRRDVYDPVAVMPQSGRLTAVTHSKGL